MKALYSILLFAISILSACNNNADKKKPDTRPVTATNFQSPDSGQLLIVRTIDSNTKQYININIHNDTTLMKELITNLSKKESKSAWDTLFPILVALLPIVLGYLGYKYAMRQIVARQKLDWISSIRSLGGRLITEIVKSQVTYHEMDNLQEEFSDLKKNVEKIQEEISSVKRKKLTVNKELSDKLEAAEKNLAEKNKERLEAEIKFKTDFFTTYQLLNEMIINLDTESYLTHKKLEIAINEFRASLDINNDQNPEELSQNVIAKIKSVVAEQRQLVDGSTI